MKIINNNENEIDFLDENDNEFVYYKSTKKIYFGSSKKLYKFSFFYEGYEEKMRLELMQHLRLEKLKRIISNG